MNKRFYYDNDICIVGLGCVLPDAGNPSEFWHNLSAGKCSIRKVPEERWPSRLYFSQDKNEPDKTYSNVAAFVEERQLEKLRDKLGPDFSQSNRLQTMALEATEQALSGLNRETLARERQNTPIFLGCMELDEAFSLVKFYRHTEESLKRHIGRSNLKNQKRIFKSIKEYFNRRETKTEIMVSSVLTTSVINLIKQKFCLQGEGALIDAACASSLAAIDAAATALKNYQANLAITGGVESNLSPNTFILFSKAGALSPGRCLPYDKKTEGLLQGEGTVIFVLQRLADALKDKNKIYGVIRSIGSSSDGRSSSLFSPSQGGQVLAFKRAYRSLDKNSVSYIEGHGTGTKVGDSTELASLSEFFVGQRLPVGSVKSLIGHTKGAAGAAGLLKCVLILQNKVIPPVKYFEALIVGQNKSVYINKEPVMLGNISRPLRLGISSFGFGNINYHLVLDEFNGGQEIIKAKKGGAASPVVILGGSSISLKKVDFNLIAAKFKIPPQSLPHMDKSQLNALLAVAAALAKANMEIDLLDKENVKVISAGCLGLDSAIDFDKRIRHWEFKDALAFLDKNSLELLIGHKNKFPEATEDTGPGVLNNVVAGRICNAFDFKGKNFNVDADFNSFDAALNIAGRELQKQDGLIILIGSEEKLNKSKLKIERTKIHCLILSTLSFAQKNNYPINELIKKIDYHE